MNRKEDYNCPHILGKLHWGVEVCTELSGIANLYFRQGIQKRQSFDQCTGLGDCHRDAGNSAVFKPSTLIPPARAKRPTTVAMNF